MTETRNTAQPAVWAIPAKDLPQHSQFRTEPEVPPVKAVEKAVDTDFMSFDDLKRFYPERVASKLPPRNMMTDDVT